MKNNLMYTAKLVNILATSEKLRWSFTKLSMLSHIPLPDLNFNINPYENIVTKTKHAFFF